MTRMTNDIRDSIERDLIRHRFQSEIDAIEAEAAKLVFDIYDATYDAAAQKVMNNLPDGWLPEKECVDVNFAGRNARIWFNGYMYRDEPLNKLAGKKDEKRRRVIFRHRDYHIGRYGAGHEFCDRFKKIVQDKQRLADAVRTAVRQTRAALNAVSTVEALIKSWPEVKPFADMWIEEKDRRPKLPAIPVESLNSALGLPVSEARP